MNREELIEEARAHLERAADAAPKSARRAIKAGEAEDQRLSLVARLASALEQARTPTEAHEKPFDTSPERAKIGADSLHVNSTDDEREAPVINYCPEHGDLLDGDRRSARCQETHSIHEIRAGFRRTVQGEPTDSGKTEDSSGI